jgi:hypothetical protein
LRLRLDEAPAGAIRLGFDVVAGGAARLPGSGRPDGASDYALVLDAQRRSGQAWVRHGIDPLPLDAAIPPLTNDPVDGWVRAVLSQNRSLRVPTTGAQLPHEIQQVGAVRFGNWDPKDPGYDSHATWRVDGREVRIRIPWLQLGLADPSSKRALVPRSNRTATTAPVARIRLAVEADRAVATADLTWDAWDRVEYTERLKVGHGQLVDALRDVARPGR